MSRCITVNGEHCFHLYDGPWYPGRVRPEICCWCGQDNDHKHGQYLVAVEDGVATEGWKDLKIRYFAGK